MAHVKLKQESCISPVSPAEPHQSSPAVLCSSFDVQLGVIAVFKLHEMSHTKRENKPKSAGEKSPQKCSTQKLSCLEFQGWNFRQSIGVASAAG